MNNSFAILEVERPFSSESSEEVSYGQENTAHPFELEEAAAIGCMKQLVELTGLPMMAVDVETGVVFAKSDLEMVTILPGEVLQQLPGIVDCQIIQLEAGLTYLVAPLPSIDNCETVAIGSVYTGQGDNQEKLMQQTAMTGLPQDQRQLWAKQQQEMLPTLMQNLLNLALKNNEQVDQELALRSSIHYQQHEIDQTAAGIRFLHRLSGHLHITRDQQVLIELCQEQLPSLIPTEGHMLLIDDGQGSYSCHTTGKIPFNESKARQLVAHCDGHDWTRPFVKDHVHGTLLGSEFPQLKNFLMASIPVGNGQNGWLLCCNLKENRNFTSVEGSLLNSIAAILGTHFHNTDLCVQNDRLVLSFVQSMVSTLDAKDPYTRGHSERVALIARSLGNAMGLPEEDLHDIYVAGLLHDIGKIGVSDVVLQKTGKLTPEEFDEIKKHPSIGYEILKDLKNLKMVLPGVRNHHERIDGMGYPDLLAGDNIPLMARILAVADAYDAMGSDRPYRKGMPVAKVEDVFRNGAGKQWDTNVIDLYFSIREEIKDLCSNYSPSQGTLIDCNV